VATWLLSVALLAFVMAGTPGPNNVLFAANWAHFGYRGTIPGLTGMLGGFCVTLSAAAVGVASLVSREPSLQTLMTAFASMYMLWLAVRLWRAGAPGEGDDARPLRWLQMCAFQLLNPKTWLASLTFASGYLAGNSPGGIVVDLVGVFVFLATVLVAASCWTLFGAAFRTRLQQEHWIVFNRVLACLALATIATFWIHV
jgi:threonine/homoserine/homoserine lactone efflux protein